VIGHMPFLMWLKKLLILLVSPLAASLLGVALGLFLCARGRNRSGRSLAAISLLWLYVWSTPAFSEFIRGRIEKRFPPILAEQAPVADAILVLGGAAGPAVTNFPYENGYAAIDRVLLAARLYHAGRAPRILVSGGGEEDASEAVAMADLLGRLGVPPEAVWMEADSHDTRQNMCYSSAVLRSSGIEKVLLVTSALHMRRALAEAAAAGIDAIPVAADHEIRGVWRPHRFLPEALALEGSSRAFKELVGYAALSAKRRL